MPHATLPADYAQFLDTDVTGQIWWPLLTAAQLAAGYEPIPDARTGEAKLRAVNTGIRANHLGILADFNRDHDVIKPPAWIYRDGIRLVRAAEFLVWLDAKNRFEGTAPFVPLKLKQAVHVAMSGFRATDDAPFAPLEKALEGHFGKPMAKLPAAQQARVESDLAPSKWDNLTRADRIRLAKQWDAQHNPATLAVFTQDLALTVQLANLDQQITQCAETIPRTNKRQAENESRLRQLRRDANGLRSILAKLRNSREASADQLSATDGTKREPNTDYTPYTLAIRGFRDRLGATPEELAAWIHLAPEHGGLAAFRDAERFDTPPRFFFGSAVEGEFDYRKALMGCWFWTKDVERFIPRERYITGKALVTAWKQNPDIRPKAFIRLKVEAGQLQDIHPTFGGTRWSRPGDKTMPPEDIALFAESEVIVIEKAEFGGLLLLPSPPASAPGPQPEPIPPKAPESPSHRRERLKAEHAELVRQRVKNPTQVLAQQEKRHPSRIRAILQKAAAPPKKAASKFPG